MFDDDDDLLALLGPTTKPVPDDEIDADLAELLGLSAPQEAVDELSVEDSFTVAGSTAVMQGVTARWLGVVFGLPITTTRRRLEAANIRPVRVQPNGAQFFSVREAAPHLVQVPDVGEHIRRMSYKDLPPQLTKAYWAGQRERLKVEEEQGDLWRSDRVISLFGDLFRMTKSQVRQWQSKVERHGVMTTEQVEALRDLSDDLMGAIYKIVENLETRQHTGSVLDEDDDFAGADDE